MIPSVTIYKNILPESLRQELVEWFFQEDHYSDIRTDCESKAPEWGRTDWPKQLVEPVVKYLHAEDYEVEMVHFFYNISSRFPVHVDSGLGEAHQSIYQGIILPLMVNGDVGTVFFNNHWTDRCSKFVKDVDKLDISEFQRNGDLKNAVVSDYRTVQGYSGRPFNQDVYNRYLQHLNIEDLEGLEFDCYAAWVPGDAIVFPRSQLHAASSGTLPKLGISIFTNKHEHK